jgi:hypothetical protein
MVKTRHAVSDFVDTRQLPAYVVNMPATTPTDPRPLRLAVIDPAAIRHVMEYPARGERWTVRELAPILGCSIGTLGHMRTGARATIPTELAERFSEAVGVETAVLFTPSVSANSDTTQGVA